MAAPHSPPSPPDSPEVKFHTADGTAEPPVRITLVVWEPCAFGLVRLSVKTGSQLLLQLARCIYIYVAGPFGLHVGF